jgi:hypothetical protein
VDVRLRRSDVLDHPRQQLAAVDEELDPVAAARGERSSLGPAAGRRSGRTMTVPCEPTAVMCRNRALHGIAEGAVDPLEREHAQPGVVGVGGGGSGAGGGGGGGGVVVGGGAGAGGGDFGVCSLTGGGELLCGAYVVVVAAGAVYVYVGTYEYDVLGALTVWPPITG